ncbi:MAG: M48 family metalloprotease [Alphaproteobacteria bacterium]|nr:M48 family metalloprotease [Alphaproteobacteria bacterium]
MTQECTLLRRIYKPLLLSASVLSLAACSTNAATGRSQFAGLMSPQQEKQVGASEHENIVKQYGLYKDAKLQAYVDSVGARIAKDTERSDVQYKFFIIDSPIVNAFALPGGYVYVSRGLLALANSEAELAGVMAHEVGHVTARHSAERYSHGVVTSLGAAVLSAAVGKQGVSQALSVGGNLYMSSYSRSQENEADSLGIRYLSRGSYDPRAMSFFLSSLQAQSALDSAISGDAQGFSYFSTHPATSDRVAKTQGEATQFPPGGDWGREKHFDMISGMTYGDSAEQGFARGNTFYHPSMRFAFDVPNGFEIVNQPTQVIAASKSTGAIMAFDLVSSQGFSDPSAYLTQQWLKGEGDIRGLQKITVNGMKGATAEFSGTVNNRAATIRLIAIQWSADKYARFQIAIPQGSSASLVEALKTASYSFRRLSEKEAGALKPDHIRIVTAKAGDTLSSLAAKQSFPSHREEHFRVLNGLKPGEAVQAGGVYKIVTH